MMENPHKDGDSRLKECRGVEVPTQNEISALQGMRRIKERVRALRSRLTAVSSGSIAEKPGERQTLEDEMQRLKSEWQALERQRKKAAHDRMVLLGHEEPSASE